MLRLKHRTMITPIDWSDEAGEHDNAKNKPREHVCEPGQGTRDPFYVRCAFRLFLFADGLRDTKRSCHRTTE